jgi:hypothetical protein
MDGGAGHVLANQLELVVRLIIQSVRSHQAPNVGRVIACGGTVVRQYFHGRQQRDRLAAVAKNPMALGTDQGRMG